MLIEIWGSFRSQNAINQTNINVFVCRLLTLNQHKHYEGQNCLENGKKKSPRSPRVSGQPENNQRPADENSAEKFKKVLSCRDTCH